MFKKNQDIKDFRANRSHDRIKKFLIVMAFGLSLIGAASFSQELNIPDLIDFRHAILPGSHE